MSCRGDAIRRIREGVDSLAKLAQLAEDAENVGNRDECSGYLFQICTVGTAMADFAGLQAEAMQDREG